MNQGRIFDGSQPSKIWYYWNWVRFASWTF